MWQDFWDTFIYFPEDPFNPLSSAHWHYLYYNFISSSSFFNNSQHFLITFRKNDDKFWIKFPGEEIPQLVSACNCSTARPMWIWWRHNAYDHNPRSAFPTSTSTSPASTSLSHQTSIVIHICLHHHRHHHQHHSHHHHNHSQFQIYPPGTQWRFPSLAKPFASQVLCKIIKIIIRRMTTNYHDCLCVQASWVWTFPHQWDQSGSLGMFSLDLTTQVPTFSN